MQNLVWIASYPKSGNTWVRLFLASLMRGDKEFDLNKTAVGTALQCSSKMLFSLGHGGAVPPARQAEEVLFDREPTQKAFSEFLTGKAAGRRFLVKSHSYAGKLRGKRQIAAGVSEESVLILRNPFDVCASLCNHFGLTMDESIRFMNSLVMFPGLNPAGLPMFLSSWSSNILSWVVREDVPLKIVRYEDLLRYPITAFQRLARDVAGTTDERRILKALKDTRFESLKSLEQESGFRERSKKAESFFVGGTVRRGFETMSREQRERLYEPNAELCRALGYHYDDDHLVIGPMDKPKLETLAKASADAVEIPEDRAATLTEAIRAFDARVAATTQVPT